jgi:hypothetical protein
MIYLDFRAPAHWSEECCDEELRRESIRLFGIQPESFQWTPGEIDCPHIRQACIKGLEYTADGGIKRVIEA